jgi:Ca2+-binding RTX toxin-like protein
MFSSADPANKGWDYMHGANKSDVLYGYDGMDQMYGKAGDDRIIGGKGHDHAWGGPGDDYINVSDGQDEPANREEVHGDGVDMPNGTKDYCVVDEDPNDGVIANQCETLVIKDIGLPGDTLVSRSEKLALEHKGTFYSPGTYHFAS